MWVFDGEEWIRDEGGEAPREKKPEPDRPRFDETTPELQVIEIVPTRKREPVPPYPMV
jgi:hypothetical protein